MKRTPAHPRAVSWLAVLAIGWPAVTAWAAEPPTPGPSHFVFAGLDREYRDESPALAPIHQGPLTVQLSSPSSSVTVESHRLTLIPLADGSHRARLDVAFFGHGTLVAEVSLSGAGSRLEDELVVPIQRRSLEGRVEIDRAPEGYVFTALELPETVEVTLESRLAQSLLSTCRAFAVLPLVALDCDLLDQRLSTAVIPLPPPGQRFLLADGLLSDEERAALDRYLERTAGPVR